MLSLERQIGVEDSAERELRGHAGHRLLVMVEANPATRRFA
jgi:hypothetical protein